MNIFNSNTLLDDFIIKNCNKHIDDYTSNLNLNICFEKYKKYLHYKNMLLFIVYKNNKIYTIFNDGDTRKKQIVNIVINNIKILKNKLGKLPNFFLPFYVSDTHFYYDNDLPFFVEAKPENKKGILYPDKDYYNILIENKFITYDDFKSLLKLKGCQNVSKKVDLIYFSGGNTGADKHNIRMKLDDIVKEKDDKKYDININTQFVPMYDFAKYKYLLNLPGHQPWSYRMTKILLMESLIFDVAILQTYITKKDNKPYKDVNKKWIQFYSNYFKSGDDYVEITYDWTENITSDDEVLPLYDKINKLHSQYNSNPNEYSKIVKSAFKKANELSNEIFDKTYQYLFLYFIEKIYATNSQEIIDKFLDNIIELDNKKNDYSINNYDINSFNKINFKNEIFLENFFKKHDLISTQKQYSLLSIRSTEQFISYLFNDVIKNNKHSNLTVVYNNNLTKLKNDNNQIKYIETDDIDNMLNSNTVKYNIIFLFIIGSNTKLLKELIITWALLKSNGYLIIDFNDIIVKEEDIDNYFYLKTFKKLYYNDIKYLNTVGKKIIIHKK
jgi:hypothetical protein